MAWKSFSALHFTTWLLFSTNLTVSIHGQTISTDTSIPPLQWINLTGLLQGSSSPPPLKNAAIGYNEPSRSVIIFGGESASGLAQSQTFLLNLDTLTWSVPTPPDNLQRTPAARSAAIAGIDSAPSNRQGFVVIGGKGSDGKGLTDVWEYDFNNQFWSEVNMASSGPLPRWEASGGIDLATPPIQDPVVPGPNNTFYLAGGYDGIRPSPFSDIWRLNISGTLSSNLPNDSIGSWDHLTIGNLPSKFSESGTVVGHQVIMTGGCTSNVLPQSGTCAEQETYVIDTQRQSETSSSVCPAPRTNPVLVRNSNGLTSTFASQVYLLLGTLDHTKWDDSNGLENGEVAILDIQTGTWSRILPSGDPGNSGKPTFPSPRQGAAVISYSSALVGRSRSLSSDTLVFGGQDSSGNLLSEIWLLRSYNGIINPSQPVWSGFGNGHLQSGINANGAGVNVTYMTKCASEIAPRPTVTTSSTTPSTSHSPPASTSIPPPSLTFHFNTSVAHKVLAPVSIAALQAAFLLFRHVSPLYQTGHPSIQAVYGSAILTVLAYGAGIAGCVIAFTSLSFQGLSQRGSMHLRTGHGIAGIVLFSLLYVALPGLLLLYGYHTRRSALVDQSHEKDDQTRSFSPEVIETYAWPTSRSAPQSVHQASSPPSSPRVRTNSWGPSTIMQRSQEEGRMSSDSESARSPSPKRGFEVTNRPSRTRKTSLLALPLSEVSSDRLRDMDWLQRRRSLNAVGELDYALTQVRREQLSTPATADGLVPIKDPLPSRPRLKFPTAPEMILHAIIQGLFLGMSILSIVYLWRRASKAGFAIFLAWTIVFYAIMIIFAHHLRPNRSILSALCSRRKLPTQTPSTHHTPSVSLAEAYAGPYVHHPAHRVAAVADDVSLSQGGPRSTETDEQEDDVDDDTRQRIMEEEMGRRDVSIVTIPKRKLWIANP